MVISRSSSRPQRNWRLGINVKFVIPGSGAANALVLSHISRLIDDFSIAERCRKGL